MKIADFGLATILDPNIPEKLKCGSPGYVAPEILNGLEYGLKADIFSAGIIFCILLTGVSPFYDPSRQIILQKNKEAFIDFNSPCWNFVSNEAKSLVAKMTAKDPKMRCTALEALRDTWFLLEHKNLIILSNAQENMKKYNEAFRFDVSRIKPEFSMVSCTPLMNARFLGRGSPLLIPSSTKKTNMLLSRCETPGMKSKELDRDNRFKQAQVTLKRFGFEHKPSAIPVKKDSGDFDETEMDEKVESNKAPKLFVLNDRAGRVPPPTPGSNPKKSLSYLKHIMTPITDKRLFSKNAKEESKEHYLKKIAFARKHKEVTKNQHNNCCTVQSIIGEKDSTINNMDQLKQIKNADKKKMAVKVISQKLMADSIQ